MAAYKGLNPFLLVVWNLVIKSQQLNLPSTVVRIEDTDKVYRGNVIWNEGAKVGMAIGMERLDSISQEIKNLGRPTQTQQSGISGNNVVMKEAFHRKRRADPEPEASSEPKGTSEPENNPNSTSELSPEPEPEMWPEPEPDWDKAIEQWKVAWPIHVYGFASILTLLGVISLFELVRIHVTSQRKTSLKVSLLIMIVIFCSTRAAALFIAQYGYKPSKDPIVVRILFSIGHPCLIAAMSLLLLVLIDTTKMNIAPPTFQHVKFIICVVFFHVILVLATDIIVAFFIETKILILICQIYYFVTGLVLTIGYARVGWKIAKNSSANIVRDRKMEKLKVLIAAASVTGLMMMAFTIYGAAGVFGIYSNIKIVDAWPWWAFQTIGRLFEVTMIIVLLFMNINVSGTGYSITALLSNCRKKFNKNKVETAQVSSAVAYSNCWVESVDQNTTRTDP